MAESATTNLFDPLVRSTNPTTSDAVSESTCSVTMSKKETQKRSGKKNKRKRGGNGTASGQSHWLTPWMDNLGMTEYESTEQRLHDEIVAYVTYCDPTEQETRARSLVISRVEELAQKRFFGCELHTFGSVASGLCVPGSDIDLVAQTTQVYEETYKARALFQLSSMLKQTLFTRNTSVAVGARVPIVTFETESTLGSFCIDISINSDDGVRAVAEVQQYLDDSPTLRPLVLVLKGFLLKRGLHTASNGGLGNHALLCLVICFLKLNPKERPNEYFTHFMENESLGVLLLDFFQFYGYALNWDIMCVSPARGEVVTKESMKFENPSRPEALSIDCFINPGCDVGKAASRATQLRKAFQEAHDVLRNYSLSMTNCNVLGTVVGVSEKTHEHREHIRHLVDSGELETNLKALQLPPAWIPPQNQGRKNPRRESDRNRAHSSSRNQLPHATPMSHTPYAPTFYMDHHPHAGLYFSSEMTAPLPYDPVPVAYPQLPITHTASTHHNSNTPPFKRQRVQY